MKFADSSLSDGGPRGGPGSNPGAGGWPTIRYYNKKTGVLGASYEKKTDMAMCSELGPEGGHYLQQYIDEAGNTSLCKIEPPYAGCSDKAIKFIKKFTGADAETADKEKERLNRMAGKDVTADAKAFIQLRLTLLSKLSPPAKDEL